MSLKLTKKRFPNKLRELRMAQRLTLGELAELVGLDESTVSRHETGARGMTTEQVSDYAKALHVPNSDIRDV